VSLDDLVKVTVTAATASPTKPGFGTVLVAAQKVPAGFITRTRKFGSLTEMTDFGFSVNDPAYRCAQKMKAQNPAIDSFIVGKRLNKATQIIELTCTSDVEGDTYAITLTHPTTGIDTTYTRTVPAASSASAEATALAALIDAHASVAAAAVGAVITITTGTVGELVNYKAWSDNLQFKDATADPGIAADLAAIAGSTSLDWYGLALDNSSVAEATPAALFVESNKKIALFTNSDWGCYDAATTTDLLSVLKTAAYARSGGIVSKKELLAYSGPALMAKQFAGAKPGQDTWMFKTLATVTADEYSASERTAILDKKGNLYSPTSGINITEEGTSGAGEFLDIVRFIDWQVAEIQFRVFTFFVNNKKVAYTDLGLKALEKVIKSALGAGADQDGLERDTIVVSLVMTANVDPATKAARKATGTFSATLQGAIHHLELQGTLAA
jgi:hypothetical protein